MCVNCLRRCLIRALLFTRSGIFVNPARVSPDILVSEFGRLKFKEPPSIAVCIMSGIITDCSIISEGFTSGPENEKTVHKVPLAPFHQDFRRDTTMWGKILYFDNLSCAISTEGMSFTTKPKTLSAPIFPASGIYYLFRFFESLHFSYVPCPALSSPKASKKVGSRSTTVMLSPAPFRRSDNYITSRSFEQRGQDFFFLFFLLYWLILLL